MTYAMFIDYEYCSGCHTCEVACQKELGLEPEEFGIECKVAGPYQMGARWQMDNVPVPTDRCNACKERVAKGKKAACVQHCQADCIRVGELADMAALVNGKHQVLFTLFEGFEEAPASDGFRGELRAVAGNYFETHEPVPYVPQEPTPSGTLSKHSNMSRILRNEKCAAMLEELNPGITSDPQLLAAAGQGVTLAAIARQAPDMIDDDTLAFLDRRIRELTGGPVPELPVGPAGLSKGSKVKAILANPQAVALFEELAPGSTTSKGMKMAATFGMTLAKAAEKSDELTDNALAYLDMQLRKL